MRGIPALGLVLSAFLAFPAGGNLHAQTRTVTGEVVAEDTGQPVPSASVFVVGTRIGALTNDEGRFVLTGVPAGEVTIRAEIIGWRSRDVVLPPGRNEARFTLIRDYLRVDEIVVTGRATTVRRQALANAVATVDAEELARVPTATMARALQGKIAGADIQKNSGAPGGGIQVNLRGVSSINAASEPLWVVDGIIVSNVAIPNNQDVVTQASAGSNPSPKQQDQVNRIADLVPYDIERIEVLKGASASAIYGSKASNGVVIITTKKGRPGPTRVDVSQRFGVSDLSEKLDFRTFRGASVDDVRSVFGEAGVQAFQEGQFFDHEEELYGRNALSTETQVSLSGGGESTTWYASGFLKDDAGIVRNTGWEIESFRANLQHSFSDRLQVTLNSSYAHTQARRGLFNNDNFLVSYGMALPFIPRFFDLRRRADGTFPRSSFPGGSNPLQTAALMENQEDVNRFLGSASVRWQILNTEEQTLTLDGLGGVDWFRQENDLFFPPELHFEPADGQAGTSLLTGARSQNLNASLNLVHAWTPAEGGWTATTSAGANYEERDLNIVRNVSRNLIAGQPNVGSATQNQLSERKERVEDFGFYLQEEVQLLDERLILTGAVRGEQSSANGDGQEIFWYPKASAALRFPELTDSVDELKLRLAYGESGNQPLFGQKFVSLDATRNIDGNPGLTVNPQAGDPGIQPERTREVEGGFDLTLFDGNATFEFTAYQQNITDLLLERELAPSSGFDTRFFNGGELRVRGVEAALGVSPFRSRDFVWVSRTTFGLDRSEVLDLPVPAFVFGSFGVDLGTYKIEEGKSATQIVGNDGPLPGGECCRVSKLGDGNPDFRASFVNDFTWGDWSLSTLVDWQQGGTIINLSRFISDLAQTTHDFVPNGAERLEAFGSTSTVLLEDASFVKVREVQLAYRVPTEWISEWWSAVDELRLSASGRDLLTFTDYSGYDPEVSNFGNQPISRNVDVAPYPPSRSFWFTISVGF